MDKKVKYFAGRIKSVDEVSKTAEVVISDETVDRYREIVKVDSFVKTKKDFMKHPVLLSSHAYRGLMMQIGQFLKLTVDSVNKEVVGKIEYFVGLGNQEADWAWELAKKGIAAFSIGFIPKKWLDYDEEERLKSGAYGEYLEIELLEVSQVLIPANPSALQKSFEEEDEAADDVEALVQKLYEEHRDFFVTEEVKSEEEVEIAGTLLTSEPDGIKELIEELIAKMEIVIEGQACISARLTSLEKSMLPIEEKTEEEVSTETVDKGEKIEEEITDVVGEDKDLELYEEFKKAFHREDPSLEEVKGLFEEMNNEIKARFSMQS